MFHYIRKKIAAKLALIIVLVVTLISIISILYFSHINKKNLTEYLNISLSNAVYFAELAYAQPLWDYNESEIAHLSHVILKNKLILAVNVFETDSFLTGSVKKKTQKSGSGLSSGDQPFTGLYQDIFSDAPAEYVETLKSPYVIKSDDPYIRKISGNIKLKEKAVGRFELFYTEEFIHNAIAMSNKRMIFSFMIIAIFTITVVMVSINRVNKPVMELALLSEKIAKENDFSINIKKSERIDEVGTLVNGFVNMIEQIRENERERNALNDTLKKSLERFHLLFSRLQQAVDNSDYSLSIEAESERDELSVSLNKVMRTLEEADTAKHNQNWLKNGQAELGSIIGREQDIAAISSKAIDFVALYVNAQVGTFFVRNESRDDFRLVASYAFRARKGLYNRFKPGEGLNGQAVLEKKIIIFTEVPDEYIKIESSLGSVSPRNIIVIPVIYENDVKGVIELGSVQAFTELQFEFLSSASEILAVAINSAIFNEKLSILLAQTREQAEELKAQQEELKATNEELEEQTRILKTSEEKLQAQQEELKSSNEELEEKNHILQMQKREIEKSNDILKQKQMEIEEKAEQLRIETKYKSEFLANMSHELRTPLNSLLILASMLSENEEKNLTPDQVESAESIYRSGRNLLHLINNILDLSKIEAKKIELDISDCSIKDMVSHFRSEFSHMAREKGIEFNTEIGPDTPEYIRTDLHRVEQIIRNMVGNAMKFTEKGYIDLVFRKPASDFFIDAPLPHLAGSEPKSDLPEESAGRVKLGSENAVAISVSDTGTGIPSDKLDAVFEAFRQVDGSIRRKHDGTGLGLSISRELASLLGGAITVESKLGAGSTFTLYIPLDINMRLKTTAGSPEPEQNRQQGGGQIPAGVSEEPESDDNGYMAITPERIKNGGKRRDSEDTSSSSKRIAYNDNEKTVEPDTSQEQGGGDGSSCIVRTILIIEADEQFASVLSDFFEKRGYRTVISASGEEGLESVIKDNPAAIILDSSLPGIDGWEVMKKLKNDPATKNIPLHIMSGHQKEELSYGKGPTGFLTKPVSIEDLDRALLQIENILDENVRTLLVVEDNNELRQSIMKLMGSGGVKISSAVSGREALGLLKEHRFDCMILDLGLPDISGFELMERIDDDPDIEMLPVVVFTGRDLTPEETARIERYASGIVLKNSVSMERLIDETALFLHRVESEMPEACVKEKVISAPSHTHHKGSLDGKKVLVVDDDMRNAFALNKFLKSKGMDVLIANNGEKALLLLESGNIPDMILMDIMMPVMDGYEAMEKIRSNQKLKSIPIIALTAKAMLSDRDECIKRGANDYLSKPLDTDKLLTLLRVWLYA